MLTVKARNRSSDRWALTELWTSLVMQRVRPSQSIRSAQTLTCCGVALSNITDGSYTVTQLNSIRGSCRLRRLAAALSRAAKSPATRPFYG